ncbi:MAG: hypothetical protein JWN23_1363 [Rhodocyclales bacterium]|nr:hypothetical protein [Rhodocyclales bacterium]
MIIGHLPAGYLISSFTYMRTAADAVSRRLFIVFGMAGAIAPDVDLLYFYLIDDRQHHHHTYATHLPIVWAALFVACAWWLHAARFKQLPALALVFCINGFVHLMLDTIVGDIWWLAPFVDKPYSLFTVEPAYHPWLLSFILHWSFLLELAVLGAALWLWRSRAPATIRLFH